MNAMTRWLDSWFWCKTITVHKLPLRFLIGSRISVSVQSGIFVYTRRIVLDETFDPERDIHSQDGFAMICAKNISCKNKRGIIDLISLCNDHPVRFVYITTVLKFIGEDFCSLAPVLKLGPTRRLQTSTNCIPKSYYEWLFVYSSTMNIVQALGNHAIWCGGFDTRVPLKISMLWKVT